MQGDNASEPHRDLEHEHGHVRRRVLAPDLGFGRMVVSETDAPNMSVHLVQSGRALVQSDNATEPCVQTELQRRAMPGRSTGRPLSAKNCRAARSL